MADEKFIAIETALAHHETQLQELSTVIAAQWKEIDRLKRLLNDAVTKIEDVASAVPANAKPPHY